MMSRRRAQIGFWMCVLCTSRMTTLRDLVILDRDPGSTLKDIVTVA